MRKRKRKQAQSCRYGRRTCERGSIAVEGRGGVVEVWLSMSLLELLRINLIGDFFPFACAEFTAVKAPVSMSVPASKKRHCIGSSQSLCKSNIKAYNQTHLLKRPPNAAVQIDSRLSWYLETQQPMWCGRPSYAHPSP
jgi:hypothetical protein